MFISFVVRHHHTSFICLSSSSACLCVYTALVLLSYFTLKLKRALCFTLVSICTCIVTHVWLCGGMSFEASSTPSSVRCNWHWSMKIQGSSSLLMLLHRRGLVFLQMKSSSMLKCDFLLQHHNLITISARGTQITYFKVWRRRKQFWLSPEHERYYHCEFII